MIEFKPVRQLRPYTVSGYYLVVQLYDTALLEYTHYTAVYAAVCVRTAIIMLV